MIWALPFCAGLVLFAPDLVSTCWAGVAAGRDPDPGAGRRGGAAAGGLRAGSAFYRARGESRVQAVESAVMVGSIPGAGRARPGPLGLRGLRGRADRHLGGHAGGAPPPTCGGCSPTSSWAAMALRGASPRWPVAGGHAGAARELLDPGTLPELAAFGLLHRGPHVGAGADAASRAGGVDAWARDGGQRRPERRRAPPRSPRRGRGRAVTPAGRARSPSVRERSSER